MLHLAEPSSATVISRLQDRQESQSAADAAASKHRLPPFWSKPDDVVSHSTYNPLAGGGVAAGSSSHKSEAVDRFLATLEQVQPSAPPSRALVATLKGKYYELLEACSALDTHAMGALSRADFELALSSSTLALQPHEVRPGQQHPHAHHSRIH